MLPMPMSEEFEAVIRGYRHPKTGEPLSPGTREKYLMNLRLFRDEVLSLYPGRKFEALADFLPQDLKDYKSRLESDSRSMKGITIATRLMCLRGFFRTAYALKAIPQDIIDGFKVRWPRAAEHYRRLQPKEVERLCAIDEKKFARMDLRKQFIYIRNITMAAVQKDAALRSNELIFLSEADIHWDRRSEGGNVPIVIREAKARARGHEDTTYLSPWGVKYLKRYLETRNAYLKSRELIPGHAITPKSKQEIGTAVFITQFGKPLTTPSAYQEEIFPALVKQAELNPEYTSHYLRHTRITEWVESGMDPKRVQRLARHTDVTMTLHYYHFNEKELVADLDKRFGTAEPTGDFTHQLTPEQPVRLALYRHALADVGRTPDEPTLERLDSTLQGNMKAEAFAQVYYTVHETCAKLKIQRTQLYVGWIKAGNLHPFKEGARTVFLRSEVDALASLRTTEEASQALGYNEKVPVTVAHMAAQGILKGTKIGRCWRFHDRDLIEYLIAKRLGRLRLQQARRRRTARPASLQVGMI